ncbi:4762_t:CDS:2 [Acaulospora colombiana]|uniref:4762_t:CDS:1 n=1 Tax=Acaulospora colombiana TaxID=27376 RepID=A0ACA9K8H6_9GLOM|nr:4762_t:CDS:2 [Acaulospora colombiana]
MAGLPDEKIVEAHGSFAKSKCLNCFTEADPDWVKEAIFKDEIPKCLSCKNGLVKPCITFFGECLPSKFFDYLDDTSYCDLLIVIGTSLKVQPFASLVDQVEPPTPRLLINREPIFGYFDFDEADSEKTRDAFYQGNCDDGVRKLAELIGWQDELEELYTNGHSKLLGRTLTTIDQITEKLSEVSISKEETNFCDDEEDKLNSEETLDHTEEVSGDVDVDKLSKDLQNISIDASVDASGVKIEGRKDAIAELTAA